MVSSYGLWICMNERVGSPRVRGVIQLHLLFNPPRLRYENTNRGSYHVVLIAVLLQNSRVCSNSFFRCVVCLTKSSELRMRHSNTVKFFAWCRNLLYSKISN